MNLLSVIIPAFNEEQIIENTANTLANILKSENINYELIFINDGSKDNTWAKINDVCKTDTNIVGICFSRNFGKEAAMFAGLEKAKGDCCVIIDCDLQHPPEKIVDMYKLWEQGYDVVEGVKENRGKEGVLHRIAANSFYDLISKATKINMSDASDFKLLDRKVVDTLNQLPERNVFFRALSYWVGYKKTEVFYTVQERAAGESKWSTRQLIKYALTNITAFSSAPLHIVTILGVITLAISFIFGLISLIQKLCGVAIDGFTTVILLIAFIGSVIMISIGILGYYIARIYDEIKGRPRYIISSTCNGDIDEKNN